MKKITILLILIFSISCKDKIVDQTNDINEKKASISTNDCFKIVFVSCSDQDMDQPLWKPILEHYPDLLIWGGDNIYADTDDMEKMESDYNKVLSHPEYAQLEENTTVIGTWDDHDYGKNDAGIEWEKKNEAQQLMLDFFKVSTDDIRRSREGVYHSQTFNTSEGSIKIILLDTRYFRSELKKSNIEGWRYEAWEEDHKGTILGEEQWKWFEEELLDDSADFTLIVSSIQFLADEHGWEKWGTFPIEVRRMYEMIKKAKAKNIIILSGDRHLAEFSKTEVEGLNYPLIDFTSSGMTKTYPDDPDDPNRYRIGDQVRQLNFGVLEFDFQEKKVKMEIRGEENKLYEVLEQEF